MITTRLYLIPWFGPVGLRRITRDSVRDFLADMATKTKAKRKKQGEEGESDDPQSKLSRNTLRLALSTLRVILNHAMDDGLIDRNPAVRLGKFTKSRSRKLRRRLLLAARLSSSCRRPKRFARITTRYS
jgi:integrase-like protein